MLDVLLNDGGDVVVADWCEDNGWVTMGRELRELARAKVSPSRNPGNGSPPENYSWFRVGRWRSTDWRDRMGWLECAYLYYQDDVPYDVFDALPPPPPGTEQPLPPREHGGGRPTQEGRSYPSRAMAMRALLMACARTGRTARPYDDMETWTQTHRPVVGPMSMACDSAGEAPCRTRPC